MHSHGLTLLERFIDWSNTHSDNIALDLFGNIHIQELNDRCQNMVYMLLKGDVTYSPVNTVNNQINLSIPDDALVYFGQKAYPWNQTGPIFSSKQELVDQKHDVISCEDQLKEIG
jgi:hypothetical protein